MADVPTKSEPLSGAEAETKAQHYQKPIETLGPPGKKTGTILAPSVDGKNALRIATEVGFRAAI